MKKVVITIISLSFICYEAIAQKIGISTNAAYWATTTMNLGVDIGLGRKTSLDIIGTYNPFEFKDNKSIKHWLVQPEFRIWTCERYNGHFFGIHTHYGEYNGGIKKFRYDGWLVGGGISYGYSWVIGKRWNLEAELGVGYAYLEYDKYCIQNRCLLIENNKSRNYVGPTKVGVNFIYFFK